MKKLKFLLIPRSNNFQDTIQIFFIGKELSIKGHYVKKLTAPLFDKNLSSIVDEYSFDVIFRIGAGKTVLVKKNTRFISWTKSVNDVLNYLDNYNQDDIIYTLEDHTLENKNQIIKNLLPAACVIDNNLSIEDLSKKKTFKINSFQEIDLSYHGNEMLFDVYSGQQKIKNENALYVFNNINEVTRKLKLSSYKIKSNFYGLIPPNKELFRNENFSFLGRLKNFYSHFEIFKKSKINLISERNFFDFNTKFFNIIIVQGFVLLDDDLQKNLINKIFNLGFNKEESISVFSENDIINGIIEDLIDNHEKRLKIAKKAHQIILESHTYRQRVEQILKDLNPN